MDPPVKGASEVGGRGDTEPENVLPAAETMPETMNRNESDLPWLPNVSSIMVTQDSQSVNVKVPSKDPHCTTTSHMEDPERNSTTLPSVEDSNVKQITAGVSELLVEKSDCEVKIKNYNSLTEKSESKTISSDQLHTNGDNSGANASERSGSVSWISEGESVLPSMGILPDAEETTDQGAQSKRSHVPENVVAQTTASISAAQSLEAHAVDPSDVVHKIKKIKWQDIEVPIITQNNNGPCPLIAIVNVMVLKGQITLPADRTEITGGDLVLVVGNALFDQPRNSLPSDMRRYVEQNTEDAISILHKLLTGLDVNVKFSGVRDFEFTGELCVFDLLGIMLYHGWVVDPSSEAAAIIKYLSYNQLTNNIFAWREEAVKNNNNDLLVKAMLCEEFMANSGSQLTIHGLFELGSALQNEEIAVLFRNNHFSTIYKRGEQLYQLLTDQGFLHENMVWETLNDVDATFSEFVNGNFETIPPAPEPSPSSSDQNMTLQQQINSELIMGGSYVDGVLQRLCACMPARLSLGAMAFLGFVMMTSVRINLSVALVAMVRQNVSNAANAETECRGNESLTMLRQEGAGNRSLVTPGEDGDEMRGQEEEEGLDWDEMTQGLVLAGFFYGYIFTQIIGGRLAEVYGTRLTFGLCGVTSGFFTLLSPIAARSHYGALIAVRVLMGFFQGPMWPSMHALLPRWIPPLERARFISVVYVASNLSMMLTMAITGVVIDFFGWEAAFYIPGAICLLWALCWFVLVVDSPSQHPRISLKEKQYIESCVREAGTSSKRPKKIPWCALLSCIPFWAVAGIHAGNDFGHSIFYNHLPTYMKNVLGLSIKENGLLSSLPFLCQYIGGLCFGTLGDWLLSSGRISVLTCRRVSSVAAMIIPALLCIATAYTGCSVTLVITCLCIATFNNGAMVNSVLVNYAEIAPNFSGSILGLANTGGAITMFLSPICVGAVIQGQQTLAQWRKVFWMAVPLYILPEIFYLFFCSTSVQPWNSTGEEEEVAEGEMSPLSQEEVKKDVKV